MNARDYNQGVEDAIELLANAYPLTQTNTDTIAAARKLLKPVKTKKPK